MESLETILLLLICVMVSSVFDQVLPRLSIPLVQIALGAVVGVFVADEASTIFSDPELFMLIFIAPLLFDEARHADKQGLWENRGAVLSLAIGLVLVTMLVVGFLLHLIVPSIPLAAAFALGAALGPTDAVAVAALGKEVSLTTRQRAHLKGEALINDASGVVCFEFAIAAAVTGSFAVVSALGNFVVEFFGGILLGFVLAAIIMFVLRRVLALGLETPTAYVLLEVCTPFFAYLLSEQVGVSGVLAVVAAGLFMKFYPSSLSVESSRYAMASENVWELVVYVVNGVVFVLLGMKLPEIIMPTWNSAGVGAAGVWLLGLVVLVCVLVVGTRFLWCLGMECHAARKAARTEARKAQEAVEGRRREERWRASAEGRAAEDAGGEDAAGAEATGGKRARRGGVRITAQMARDALITTLSGPKGAVTLSIVLSIPYFISTGDSFPNRDLLIFLASGVIVLTLVLANFVVPALSPGEESSESAKARSEAEVEILQNVIMELEARKTPATEAATLATIEAYRNRIEIAREDDTAGDLVEQLRLQALREQLRYVRERMDAGEVGRAAGERYAGALARRIDSMKRGRTKKDDAAAQLKTPFTWVARALGYRMRGGGMNEAERREMRALINDAERHADEYLQSLAEGADEEGKHIVELLRSEHVGGYAAMNAVAAEAGVAPTQVEVAHAAEKKNLSLTGVIATNNRVKAKSRAVEAEALSIELEQIQQMRESGRISGADARELRNEVYVLQMGLEAR